MATVVERKYEESKEVEVIDEPHTDRDIVKGHTTTNGFEVDPWRTPCTMPSAARSTPSLRLT